MRTGNTENPLGLPPDSNHPSVFAIDENGEVKLERQLDEPIRLRTFSCAPCLKKKKSCCGQAPDCARCKDGDCSFDAGDIAAAKAHRYSSTTTSAGASSSRPPRKAATPKPITTPKATPAESNKSRQSRQLDKTSKSTTSKPETQRSYNMRKRSRAQYKADLADSEPETDSEVETGMTMPDGEEEEETIDVRRLKSSRKRKPSKAIGTVPDGSEFEGFSPPPENIKKIQPAHDIIEEWSSSSSEDESDESETPVAPITSRKRKRPVSKKQGKPKYYPIPKLSLEQFEKERARISDDEEDYVKIRFVEPTSEDESDSEVAPAEGRAPSEPTEAQAMVRTEAAIIALNIFLDEQRSRSADLDPDDPDDSDGSEDSSTDEIDSDDSAYWATDSDSDDDPAFTPEELAQARKRLEAAEDLGTGFKLGYQAPQPQPEKLVPVLSKEQYDALVLQRALEAKAKQEAKQEARDLRCRQLMRIINAASPEEIAAIKDVVVRKFSKKYTKGPLSKTLLAIAKRMVKQIRRDDPDMDDNAVYTELMRRWKMCWDLYLAGYMDGKRETDRLTKKHKWRVADKVKYLRSLAPSLDTPTKEWDAIQLLFCYACISMHGWDKDPDYVLARWCYFKYIWKDLESWYSYMDIVDWRKDFDEDLSGSYYWFINVMEKRKYNDNRLVYVSDGNGGEKLVVRRWFLKELNLPLLWPVQAGKFGGAVEEKEDEELEGFLRRSGREDEIEVEEVREEGEPMALD